jgi:hypothetical protein
VDAVSPELVLVSPPEEAAAARAALEPPARLTYERPRPRFRALAVFYAVCVIVTALPVALLLAVER